MATTDKVEEEVKLLVKEINRLGTKDSDGVVKVKFGTLFDDDKCQQLFEALLGTLRAAKKRGTIDFPGQLLLKGTHDKVEIVLKKA